LYFSTENLPGANQIHKTESAGNDARQNTLATWTEVKTLHKQKNVSIQSRTQTNEPMEYNCEVRLPLQAEILERFQSKVLPMIVVAPWYAPNTVIPKNLQTPIVKEDTPLQL
jgi:predicted class III extradiol MEMO1 family dioxygenase